MTDQIDDVMVVGGGDSGLLAALALSQRNPALDVSVVDDFGQDIPQVGKSTYLAIRDVLHGSLDIPEQRFVTEVRPVWKASVYFRDWCGYEPFHYPFDVAAKFPSPETPDAAERLSYYYDEIYDSPDHRTTCEQIVAQGTSPWYFDPRDGQHHNYENTAYHLNTERFNAFLREVCRERGISLIDDEIMGVDADGSHVERVRSKRQRYEAGLFVDATGFNRVLKGELDSEFVEFAFPLDSAYNTRVDRPLSEVIPATVVETGDHGWFWGIDTYDNRDLGYVYASAFVSEEDALAEFLEHCPAGVSAADVASYSFTTGYYERAWEGNCVAIGNSEGFVEPLQSTGLTANAQAAVTLSNLLSARGGVADAAARETYNAWVGRLWRSIRDFIAVHYEYATGDTAFWDAMDDLDLSPRVEFLVRAFDRGGFDTSVAPTRNDPDVENLLVFRPRNFYDLMRNMGATSAFYETGEFAVSDDVRREVDDRYRDVRDDVEGYLTTEEVYKGLLGLS